MAIFKSLLNEHITNLKSLKYGDSKPFVTKDIPTSKEYQIGPDPKRNGLELQAGARLDDLTRITKLLASKQGLKFTANQTLLVASETKSTTKKDGSNRTVLGNILNIVGKSVLSSAKIIASTLAQVPVSGTGEHFVFGYKGRNSYIGKEAAPLIKGLGVNNNQIAVKVKSTLTDKNEKNPVNPTTGKIFDPNLEEIYKFDKEPKKPHTVLNYNPTAVKETKYKLGNPGKAKIIGADAKSNAFQGVDRVNYTPPSKETSELEKDFIKFYFQIIKPSFANTKKIEVIQEGFGLDNSVISTTVPTSEDPKFIQFRAFLDSFDDSFNADWSEHKYIGRGESFYTYGGFSRDINISFKIAAQSALEMKPLYQKIVLLASITAPTYSDSFMKGTLVRTTIGDYLHSVPGVIKSVNYSWDSSYPWQLRSSDVENQELPMVLNCSISFAPIHDFIPQTGLFNFITSEDAEVAYMKNGAEWLKNIDYNSYLESHTAGFSNKQNASSLENIEQPRLGFFTSNLGDIIG